MSGYKFKRDRKQRFSLILLFSGVVFVILLIAITIAAVAVGVMAHLGLIGDASSLKLTEILLFMGIISAVIGVGITMLLLMFPLKPINTLINKMNALASGQYATRLEYKGVFDAIPGFTELTESFNTLAHELEGTELLRSDFINNFSHEFKTPIVSISGLARLLSNEDIGDEEKKQYIKAIEEESLRLSDMATNVLSLTKVESQTILGQVSRFNLSEQIRACLLLLESKWTEKSLELSLDFAEHSVEANEELLKQVWINLLDNAVKFTPRCGTVRVDISEDEESIAVTVTNTGSDIPHDKIDKIWQKFYQADESRSVGGNGVGLAIVKRIVTLHNGSVNVKSENSVTAFTVILPVRQNG